MNKLICKSFSGAKRGIEKILKSGSYTCQVYIDKHTGYYIVIPVEYGLEYKNPPNYKYVSCFTDLCNGCKDFSKCFKRKRDDILLPCE